MNSRSTLRQQQIIQSFLGLIKRLILSLLLFTSAASAEEAALNVYNWSGYMPNDVLTQFTQETGIRVNYTTYDSNETLYAKLKANSRSGYDLIVPSTYFVSRMRKANMLKKIDLSRLPNFKNLNPALLNRAYDPHNQYSIPYLWSVTGIVFNDRYHTNSDLRSWSDLWKKKYVNQLLLLDDRREVFSIALLTLNYSPNDTNPQHIREAYLKLKELMPNIKVFNDASIKSMYIDEDFTLGMGWNGDIYFANQENPHIQFVYPKEGFVISIDSLAIPVGAKHIDNAYKFINFILRPEVAKKISLQTGYASANLAAEKLMPKAIVNNPSVYPNANVLKRGVLQTDVGDADAIYEKYWEQLKMEDSD